MKGVLRLKSRNGIYYNLSESDYRVSFDGVVAYFSSPVTQNKYYQKRLEHRKEFNIYYSSKLGLQVDFGLLADIILYSKMEKRGFRLVMNGGEYRCLNSITLGGVKAM